jgi:hypothetical protein
VISQEQVLALAPDASSIKAGEALASARKWLSVGRDARALWGLLQGSGKQPYQARVALSDLSSSCSCPSRKFPCKHGIGLMLLYARQPEAVAEAAAPDFVEEWLSKRDERAAKKAEAASAPVKAPEDPEAARAAARKREAARDKRLGEGLEELRVWLRDLAGEGLGAQDLRQPAVWEQRARRLNDAQLPGLARQLTELGSAAATRADWIERVACGLGRIHLSLQAWEQRASRPDGELQDLQRFFGAVQRESEIAPESRVDDDLYCVGEHSEQQDRLSVCRSWLRGSQSGREALLLNFAVGNQPMPAAPVVGATHRLSLGFFPSQAPLRALVLGGEISSARAAPLPFAGGSVAQALSALAARVALDPWGAQYPMLLNARLARDEAGTWWLADAQGDALLVQSKRSMFEWLARACGESANWFGEWDGHALRLLGCWPP